MQVVIGRIGRAHGIRGAVTVEVRTDEPEQRFAAGATLSADPPAAQPLVIESTKWHAGRLIVHFEGIVDRTGAETLRGTMLIVERPDDEVPDDPDEFYDSQLRGMSVVLSDGTTVGQVKDIAHLPSQELLVVDHEGAELLVPFVNAIVTSVDLAQNRMVIDPPAGLIPDDRPTAEVNQSP